MVSSGFFLLKVAVTSVLVKMGGFFVYSTMMFIYDVKNASE